VKIEITKEWCMQMAQHEFDDEIGVGLLASDLVFNGEPVSHRSTAKLEESHVAFGRLVRLMRRDNGFSIEKLAGDANIDIEELIDIEEDAHYRPDVRTVYQLANVFGLPRTNLLKIAGLVEAQNDALHVEAVRFAARSEPVAELTSEEKAALEAFVAILSKE
jgi:transcriptional regulator with XRE-family HTH domain